MFIASALFYVRASSFIYLSDRGVSVKQYGKDT